MRSVRRRYVVLLEEVTVQPEFWDEVALLVRVIHKIAAPSETFVMSTSAANE